MYRLMKGIMPISLLVGLLIVPGVALAAPPPQVQEGESYIVQSGDWLSKLAQKYYGDPLAYPTIVEATNAKAAEDDSFSRIDNPNLIEVGQKLWIPAAATAQPPVGDLALTQLRNATYQGIYDQPIQLSDGEYEGPPFVEGGASRPTVTFIDRFYALGDLNGDGVPDAAALLAENSGGSGVFVYLAAVLNLDDQPVNAATQLLGDRPDTQSIVIDQGEILLSMLVAGPDSPMCCPDLPVSPRFRLEGDKLVELTDYVGSYQATLPAADSAGRDMTLTLEASGVAELSTDYMNGQPPIIQSGSWQKQEDGSIVVALDQKDGQALANPVTITFWLSQGQLVSTIYDLSLFGSQGLRLQKQD
jgi:hypothetical protein